MYPKSREATTSTIVGFLDLTVALNLWCKVFRSKMVVYWRRVDMFFLTKRVPVLNRDDRNIHLYASTWDDFYKKKLGLTCRWSCLRH